MEKENFELGCLGIGEQSTDYVLCDGDSNLLPPLTKKDEIRFEYNQWNQTWSKKSCTIFAAMGMYSDLTNYEFSIDEIKEVDETSYNNPDYTHIRRRNEGWYVKDAVDHVRKYVNNRKDLVEKYWKVASYRISKYDNEIIEDCIGKLYTIDWNYCPTVEFNQDYLKDWMLDGTDFGVNTNWHSVDVICKDGQRSVKNSYKGKKYNIFWLKNKLSAITNFWTYFYVYTLVKEDNLEEIKRLNEIKSECNILLEHLSELWHLSNSDNFKSILHYTAEKIRWKIDDCNKELEKYI